MYNRTLCICGLSLKFLPKRWLTNLSIIFLILTLAFVMRDNAYAAQNLLDSSHHSEDNPSVLSDQSVFPQAENIVIDSLIIHLEKGTTERQLRLLLAKNHYLLEKFWPQFSLAKVSIPSRGISASSANAIQRLNGHRRQLEQLPNIHDAYYNTIIQVPDDDLSGEFIQPSSIKNGSTGDPKRPNDELYSEQWSLELLDVVKSWEICQGHSSSVIALIDSGFDTDHPDLDSSSLWVNIVEMNGEPGIDDDGNGFIDDYHGWDWIDNDNVANDELGHGTHVGGSIVAKTDNYIGISGVAPHVKIMPLRILREDGKGEISDLVDALAYALRKGVKIANLSLVSYYNSPPLAAAVEIAHNEGLLMVAATGNLSSRVYWPAAYPETLAVTATGNNDAWASFGNFGQEVDIAAPGVDIISTYIGGEYHRTSGTSMATPYVSALAALIASLRPDLTHTEIRETITSTAEDINHEVQAGFDHFVGWGRINFHNALLKASEDLVLSSVEDNQSTVFTGDQIEIQYRVSIRNANNFTPQAAKVKFELTLQDEILFESYAVTENGIADFNFEAPKQRGEYVIKVKHGNKVAPWPLFVQVHPDNISIHPQSTEIVVHSGVLIRLEIKNSTNSHLEGTTPFTIHTTAGTIKDQTGNSYGREFKGIATNGEYVFSLVSDGSVETAIVTVTVDKLTETREIQFIAGSPTSISCQDAEPLVPIRSINRVSINCIIEDSYTNPVRDGTKVQMGSQLEETIDGQVTFEVTVPSGPTFVDDEVIEQIRVLETDIQRKIQVPVMKYQSLMPIIYN